MQVEHHIKNFGGMGIGEWEKILGMSSSLENFWGMGNGDWGMGNENGIL